MKRLKKASKSKDIWATLIVGALVRYVPQIKEIFLANPETSLALYGAINIVIDYIKEKLAARSAPMTLTV